MLRATELFRGIATIGGRYCPVGPGQASLRRLIRGHEPGRGTGENPTLPFHHDITDIGSGFGHKRNTLLGGPCPRNDLLGAGAGLAKTSPR